MENGKRKKKYIKSLVFVDGALLEDQQSITKDILNFFASLYNKSIEDTWRLEGWIGLQSLSGYSILYRRGNLRSNFSDWTKKKL